MLSRKNLSLVSKERCPSIERRSVSLSVGQDWTGRLGRLAHGCPGGRWNLRSGLPGEQFPDLPDLFAD